MRLIHHFARLPIGLVLLWLFLIWYLVMTALHFDPSMRLWLNSLGMAVFVGTALMLSAHHGGGTAREFWRVFRFYVIPFCVSSFSGLVRNADFYAIFAPTWKENLIALAACAAFGAWIFIARRWFGPMENQQ